MSKKTLCGLSCSCRDVVHLTWAAPSTKASTKPDITIPDRLSPPQISFPAAGTHCNGITIIDSADEPEEYMGPLERSHSFVSAYVMHCFILPATLSPCSPLRLQVRSNSCSNLSFKITCVAHIEAATNNISSYVVHLGWERNSKTIIICLFVELKLSSACYHYFWIHPLIVTITLDFCMLSLHNLTIFFA